MSSGQDILNRFTGGGLSDIPSAVGNAAGKIPVVGQLFNSPPSAPDYSGTAESDYQTARGDVTAQTGQNRPNQYNPFASSTWAQGPNGEWTQNVGFSGPLAGAAQGLGQQFADAWAKPFDDGTAARDSTINSMWGQAQSRLNPMWDQRNESMQSQLANQGLDPNSEAYRNASGQFGRDRNDAYTSALSSALMAGNQAQANTFNENMQARMAPLQGLQGLQGLTNQSNFNSAGVAPTPNSFGAAQAAGNYGMQGYQAQNQFAADVLGAGAQAGKAFATSDERVKQNIWDTGMEVAPGVPLTTFEYKSQPGLPYAGVIAQDLEQVAPQHVTTGPGGVKMVSPQFAPIPMANMGGSSGGGFLTPEMLKATMALGGLKRNQGALEHQLALAEAMRDAPVQKHSTGLGALIGGIGDIYSGYQGGKRAEAAQAGLSDLGTKQDASRDAYAQALIQALMAGGQ